MSRFTLREFDIVIAGGRLGGLFAAAIIGASGYRVLCCDSKQLPVTTNGRSSDGRTTALFLPAVDALRDVGVWDQIEPFSEPLEVMRIIDAGDGTPQSRRIRDFDPTSISESCFGWCIPNSVLMSRLSQKINHLPNVEILTGIGVSSVLTRTDEVRIRLSDGTRVRTKLLVAADGRESSIRTAVGLRCRTFRFSQKALTFNLFHTRPHCGVSTEIYRSGGTFTSVPVPDEDGNHASAIVWMERAAEIAALKRLPASEFESRVRYRSLGLLGDVRLASDRNEWSVVAQIAERFFAERTAIIAEAAHVLPPIGAQGFNMTIGDILGLHKIICEVPEDLGNSKGLLRYHRARYPEAAARLVGIGGLSFVSMARDPVLTSLRRLGLSIAGDIEPLRRILMRGALGQRAA